MVVKEAKMGRASRPGPCHHHLSFVLWVPPHERRIELVRHPPDDDAVGPPYDVDGRSRGARRLLGRERAPWYQLHGDRGGLAGLKVEGTLAGVGEGDPPALVDQEAWQRRLDDHAGGDGQWVLDHDLLTIQRGEQALGPAATGHRENVARSEEHTS